MKRLIVLLTAISLIRQLHSQPGGGGGLIISNFYNDKLEVLNIYSDTLLKIRIFNMRYDLPSEEIFPYYFSTEPLKLPPVPYGESRNGESDYRLYLIYANDTMIVDFIEVMGENAGGSEDKIDSLVIQRGHFKFFRTMRKDISAADYYAHYGLFHSGLTIHSKNPLVEHGILEFTDKINTNFLLEENLPENYFLKSAVHNLSLNQTEAAFSDISIAIKKNNGKKDLETMILLSEAYEQSNQLDKSIESITDAIHCENCEGEDMQSRYGRRIRLFIKAGKFGHALNDYNTLVAIGNDKLNLNIARAEFKINYLKDYKGAIRDFTQVIDNIPVDHLHDRPQGYSEYCTLYFKLGHAEYHEGDVGSATKHWLKAEEFGYEEYGYNTPIMHFDSIIQMHSKIPELYLARAIAQFRKCPNSFGDQTNRKCFDDALADLDKAKKLGMNDYRINMYRASILNRMKESEKALEEINIAISKNDKDPRCFLIRYYIKDRLAEINKGDNGQSDIEQFNLLREEWKWADY